MGIKTLIMILASLSFTVSAVADDHEMGGEKKPFSIFGDFAGSIQFLSSEGVGTNHDEFNFDLAEINLEKNWSASKLHLSLGFGETAAAVNPIISGGTPTNALNIMNAYYGLTTSYGLGFMFGKFESPIGHERYNHMDNPNYGRSYGFNLTPYFQTGLGLSYGQPMWKVGFIASNGNGFETDTNDNNKTMALTVDVDPIENMHFDLNYVTGTQANSTTCQGTGNCTQIAVLDFSWTWAINEMLDVALNYVDNSVNAGTDEKANSIAAYVNGNFGMFGAGLRYEMYSYDDGAQYFNGVGTSANPGANAVTGTDNSINAITLTVKAEIDQNALALLEYQMDSSDDKIWNDKDGTATDSQNKITAAVMYRF